MKTTVVSKNIYLVFEKQAYRKYKYTIFYDHEKIAETVAKKSRDEIIAEIHKIIRIKFYDLPLYINTIDNPLLSYRLKKGV